MTDRLCYFIIMFILLNVFFPPFPKIAVAKTIQAPISKEIFKNVPPLSLNAEKKWPDIPLRGINTKLVMPLKNNSINTGTFISNEIFNTLTNWGVNVIRVDIGVDKGSVWDVEKGEKPPPIPADNPLIPYRKQLQGLETCLNLASRHNIYVIVSAGNVVGRKIDVLYNEDDGKGYYNELPKLWKHIAKRFGAHKNLLAYDVLNEPFEKKGEKNWRDILLPELIRTIREIDKNTYLVVEPAAWGSSKSFKNFIPVNDSKTVYSFHFYSPHTYTYQGTRNLPRGLKYPDLVRNPEQMRDHLKQAILFQKRYNVRMFVGEFSVVRWAPGAAEWLYDAVSLFEEYGWDWCYHGYGGWNGWNPTFTADDPQNNEIDGGKETDRLRVLKKAWMKNRARQSD